MQSFLGLPLVLALVLAQPSLSRSSIFWRTHSGFVTSRFPLDASSLFDEHFHSWHCEFLTSSDCGQSCSLGYIQEQLIPVCNLIQLAHSACNCWPVDAFWIWVHNLVGFWNWIFLSPITLYSGSRHGHSVLGKLMIFFFRYPYWKLWNIQT